MAKDGSNRGGARPGAGRKKKTVQPPPAEKVLTLFKDGEIDDLPKPDSLLAQKQGGEIPLDAVDVFYSICRFLKTCGAGKNVPKELVELFAMTYARWKQAETLISEKSFLAPHPTTGVPYTSPLVQISTTYAKQAQQYWFSIYSITKDVEKEDDDGDMMDFLKKGRIG